MSLRSHAMAITASVTLAALALTSTPGEARETEWLKHAEWERKARALRAVGEMPVSVQCKGREKVWSRVPVGLVKLRIADNSDERDWQWVIGPDYGLKKRQLESSGYTLVSSDQYRRRSGLLVRCGIWHRSK